MPKRVFKFNAVALATFATISASAQVTVNTELQRVEVTGSHIARQETEGTSPLQIITREEIARTGAKTLKEALSLLIPTESGSTEMGTSGFTAPGYDGTSLGPLGNNATLLLLNFRRVAPYPLMHDSIVVVNVNTLPLEAVERIEVLRSGASSIYGSEAIAGVINIITRPGFEGSKLQAQQEHSVHSGQFGSKGAAITFGAGNMANDGFNAMSSIELYQRDRVNWRDALPYINPVYIDKFPNLGSYSSYSYPGNLIGGNTGPIAGCDPSMIIGGLCRYDRYKRFELIAAADRVNAFNTVQWQLDANTRAFGELLLSSTKTNYTYPFQAYGPALGSVQWVVPSTGEIKTFTYRGLPSAHPLNTTGQDDLDFRYRFADGYGETNVQTLQYRALAGLRGTWNAFDWETALGTMGGQTEQRDRGAFSASGFRQVIGNDDPSQSDPLFFSRGYKIGQPNSAAVLNTLFPSYGYDGRVVQSFADARLNGPAFDMTGGKAMLATGVDLRHETHRIQPTDSLLNGDIVGGGMRDVNDSRNVAAVFGELSLPVTNSTTVDLAGRVDKYSQFDAHFSPKVGLRFAASPRFTVRATMETGFRAPNLLESANSADVNFAGDLRDPVRCAPATALAADLRARADKLAGTDPQKLILAVRADNVEFNECHASVTTVLRGNPALQPETSVAANLGLVFQPSALWSMSADYWSIRRRDEIGFKSFVDLLLAENQLTAGQIERRSLANDSTFTAAERAQYGVTNGQLQNLTARFENGAETILSGVDLAVRGRTQTALGPLDLSSTATVYTDFQVFNLVTGRYDSRLAGLPHMFATVGAALQSGDFTHGLTFKYISSTPLSSSPDEVQYTPADCESRGWSPDQCRNGETVNFDYSLSYRGIKNLVLSGFIRNLFDRHQALSLRSLDAGGAGLIPQSYQDAQGRAIGFKAEYRIR